MCAILKQLIYLVLSTCLLLGCEPCGVSTHISISQEALHFFKKTSSMKIDYPALIRENEDAFVAGAPYPDAMYSPLCFFGWLGDVAEDTHWVPFLRTSIEYIRNKYPQPWNKETRKLVAFLFGIASHQISDVTWHGLGIEQGFIDTMAALNFNNVYGSAHTTADFGGDMLIQFAKDIANIKLDKWYVPVDDLYAIYQEYYKGNRTVSKVAVEVCSKLLYLELLLESSGGALIVQPFVKKSPFLLTHMYDYFLGGIHDMASWTDLTWRKTAFMFDNGLDSCNQAENPIFLYCINETDNISLDYPKDEVKRNTRRRFQRQLTSKLKISDLETKRTERGIYIYPGKLIKHEINKRKLKIKVNKEATEYHYNTYPSLYPYANMGKRLAKMRISNQQYIVVSAPNYGKPGQPQTGKVLILKEKSLTERMNTPPIIEEMADLMLEGEQEMTKFGWDVTPLFYNDDQFEDLAVSAPVTGANNLNYFGKVYIYFGWKDGISVKPNVTLNFMNQSQYTNFGHTLFSCESTLLIGSPFENEQSGMVRSILLKGEGSSHDLHMETNYTWFGYHGACFSSDNSNILLVGAPMLRKNGKQAVGAVYVYRNQQLIHTITGNSKFSEFGSRIAIGRPFGDEHSIIVAISSPARTITGSVLGVPYTLHQAGEVTLYNLTALLDTSSEQVVAKYRGDRPYGRFGEEVKFVDIDEDGKEELIVSAPLRSKDLTEELFGGGEGAVYVFDTFHMSGDVTDDCRRHFVKPCPGEKAEKVFYGDEANARFGTAFEVTSGMNKEKKIVISSPFSSIGSFRGGAISIRNL